MYLCKQNMKNNKNTTSMKKLYSFLAMCLVSLSMMAQTTELTGVTLQSWSAPMTFTYDNSSPWTVSSGNQIWSPKLYKDQSSTLTMTVNPTVKSTIAINFYHNEGTDQNNQNRAFLDVYLDKVLVRTITSNVGYHLNPTYFFDVEAGEHVFQFVARQNRTDANWNQFRIIPNGMIATDHIVVAEVTEPGSLGTEVLYDNTIDVLADVRCLRITGQLNDTDWTTLRNMSTTLWKLDLSGVTNTTIPARQFKRDGTTWQYLHEVVLPNNLTKINDQAFMNSFVTDITFPASIDVIGHDAFHKAQLDAVTLPANYCTTPRDGIAGYTFNTVFMDCQAMKSFTFAAPEKITRFGDNFLRGCISLTDFTCPSNVTELNANAFLDCWNNDFGTLSSVKNFGETSVHRTNVTHLDLKNAEFMHDNAFHSNRNLESVTLGEKFWKFERYGDFKECPKLTTVKLYSPTVCQYNDCFNAAYRAGMTLQVPNYLVNNYKVDANWMTFGTIEGFATDEVAVFPIHKNLTLGARQRMEGSPSLTFDNGLIFKIAGETPQSFNEVVVKSNRRQDSAYGEGNGQYNQIISTCPNVSITKAQVDNYVYGDSRYANPMWYYMSLPFDVCVDDITTTGGSFAVRYYDGAERATNGIVSGNKSWKDYQEGDVIPAGTGFILINSMRDQWVSFPSTINPEKMFSTTAHVTPLTAHASAQAANANWNFIGNPYQCYFDAKMMSFSAPITIWTNDYYGNPVYTAYSLLDDNYILRPNEGFFVQAPDGVDHITFALEGKQTDRTVATRAKAMNAPAKRSRFLVDLTIDGNESSDRTRVVLNEDASYDYEMTCDASKMFGDGLQVYTIGTENTAYAINERPQGDGSVNLGVMIPADGSYTFTMTRNSASNVILIDHYTGTQTDMRTNNYVFSAAKGTFNDRFTLIVASDVTGISNVVNSFNTNTTVYDITGRRVANSINGLKNGIYVVNGRKVYVK